jgi:SulP family sulfate permease
VEYPKGKVLYSRGDESDGFYLLQSGILRAEYDLDQGNYHESIVAGTTCGELPFFSETNRTGTVLAELDCVAWLLTPERWADMQKDEQDVAAELLKVGMKLSAERMNAITS